MPALADVERGRERLPQPPPPPPPPQTVGEAFVRSVLRGFFGALALVLIVYAYGAWGQETTIEVPQGSPVFPSVAQVDCLEDASSGRLCAATFECADGSMGELWPDMGNPDGRRTTSADHDVAIKRGCVVTVDGQAAVRWFSGFRPGGRAGDLLGVTTMAAAKRPVVRSAASGTSDGLLLDWLIDEHGYDVQALLDNQSGYIRDEAPDRRRECESSLRQRLRSLLDVAATEYTRCVAELVVEQEDGQQTWIAEEYILRFLLEDLDDGICRRRGYPNAKRDECCDLYNAEARRFGID